MSQNDGIHRLVTYFNNASVSLTQAAQEDYTHIILSFLTPDSSGGITLPWYLQSSSAPTYKGYIQTLQQAGKKVMISYGGGDVDNAYYIAASHNIPALAAAIGFVVSEFGLDGVDIDYEDTNALSGSASAGYDGVSFMENLTDALYKVLDGKALSHAPQIPYVSNAVGQPHGRNGYIESYIPILQSVGTQIDWLNVQFYNNQDWNGAQNILTLYKEIVAGWQGFQGWPADKMLTGMILSDSDGSGYVPLTQFNSEVVAPLTQAYGNFGGVMGWQYSQDPQGTWAATLAETMGRSC